MEFILNHWMKQVNKNILYEKVSGHIGLTMVAWKQERQKFGWKIEIGLY